MNALFLVSAGARLKVAEFLFEKWWRKQEENERESKKHSKKGKMWQEGGEKEDRIKDARRR